MENLSQISQASQISIGLSKLSKETQDLESQSTKTYVEIHGSYDTIQSMTTADVLNHSMIDQIRKISETKKVGIAEAKIKAMQSKRIRAFSLENVYEPNEISEMHQIWESEETLCTFRNSNRTRNSKVFQQECNKDNNESRQIGDGCLDVLTFIVSSFLCR